MSTSSFEPGPDPIALFEQWFAQAVASGADMPEAVALATATTDGAPSVRMVLFRGLVRGAFAFYTNYESRKAGELDANPRAALCFHWVGLGRQVRVEGSVTRTTCAESEAYFRDRPRESQLGAWASPQSCPLTSRDELLRLVDGARALRRARGVLPAGVGRLPHRARAHRALAPGHRASPRSLRLYARDAGLAYRTTRALN